MFLTVFSCCKCAVTFLPWLLVAMVRILSCEKLLPLFVHTAWKELKYRNVRQLRALARRNFQGNKTASM